MTTEVEQAIVSQAAWCAPGRGFDEETVKRWLKWLASLAFLISMSLGIASGFVAIIEKSAGIAWAGTLASISPSLSNRLQGFEVHPRKTDVFCDAMTKSKRKSSRENLCLLCMHWPVGSIIYYIDGESECTWCLQLTETVHLVSTKRMDSLSSQFQQIV